MKKKWLLALIAGVITITGIASSCRNAPEDEPWASFASEVAQRINVSESEVFDAFNQAFKDGTDTRSDGLYARLRILNNEDIEQILTWYQNRPVGVTIGGLYTINYFGVEIDILLSGSDKIADGLASEVASILGLGKQIMIDAFHEVMRESVDERHKEGLDSFIAEGYLTKDQVERYLQWYLSRPDVVTPGRMRPIE